MGGKCVKQETIAVIESIDGKYFIGSNWCNNAQFECPRKDMESGTGYELCKEICNQHSHAEVDVCENAGKYANGGTLYLLGHTYCCDDCKSVMNKYGIRKVVIGNLPMGIIKKIKVAKEGRWKGAGMGDYICSLCDETISGKTNFCPNCGADMR